MSVEIVRDVDSVDNFIVDKKHTPNIETCLNKIQEIFGVKVEFDNVVKITGESEKQWLKITGGKWDKQSAKEYIIGLCNPEETLVHKCSRALSHDELMNIEKNTNAVIQRRSDTELVISGTQLAVTLALSAVEELVSSKHGAPTSSDLNNHSLPTRDSAASDRLNCTLHRALTEIGDGNSKSEDYHSVPDSVKRVILDCLSHEDVSESELDRKEMSHNSSSRIGNHLGGSQQRPPHHHHHTSSGDASTTKTAFASSLLGGLETDGGGSFVRSEVGTSSKGKESGDKINSELDYLRKLGLSVGYTKEEVEEGLLRLKDSVKPADYLHILETIKGEKDDMEVSSPALVISDMPTSQTVSDTIVIPDSSEMDSHHDNDVIFISEHVKTSIKPVKPKSTVGGLSAKEKRDTDLEQRKLREMFLRQQGSGSKLKGKKDKKVSKTETGPSKRAKSPLGTKRKQLDSSDDDQTCVMEVWQSSGTVGSSSSSTSYPQMCRQVSEDSLIPNMMELSTQPLRQEYGDRQLRYIVVDGSNVAMEHGNGKVFSCRGIEICVNYFLTRGHKVTVFVPQWRKYRPSFSNTIVDQPVLDRLHSNGNLVFTPSRRIQGKTIASYDDRYILSLAEKEDGVIVSNDQYRDLMLEKQSWSKIIEERLLMFNFVNDHFMPPEDPLGRNGPRLDEFLSKPAPKSQPAYSYAQPQSTTLESWPTAAAAAMSRFQPHEVVIGNAPPPVQPSWPRECPKTHHQDRPRRDNLHQHGVAKVARQRDFPVRHPKVTEQLFEELRIVFPEKNQEEKIRDVLRNHNTETDLNRLTNYCMSALFL